MALSGKNFCCFCGIWVYMIIIVTASPANRRAIAISKSKFFANATQNNSVCWMEDVVYNNQDVVPSAGPCEHCVCNAPDIVCSVIKCDIKISCKIIQKLNQCCPDFDCDCEYNGKMFNNGEKINTSDMPCRVCYCKGGDVMCTTIGCYERDDCVGTMVPGSCCLKYDHCPPTDANNKSVEITQTKMDLISLHNSSHGLQLLPLAAHSVIAVTNFFNGTNESNTTTNHPEMTFIMKPISKNTTMIKKELSENVTLEDTDTVPTVDQSDVAQEALNTVKIATPSAAPSTISQKPQVLSTTQPDLPTNVSQGSHITSNSSDLIAAMFAYTEITEKSPSLSSTSSTQQTTDSMKLLNNDEKLTMAILQKLYVKTTIEPIATKTMETVDAKTIEPIAAETSEQIGGKMSKVITTTDEPAVEITHSLFSLLDNDLTVHTTVIQAENGSQYASIDDNVKIIEILSISDVISNEGVSTNDITTKTIVRFVGKDRVNDVSANDVSATPKKLNEQKMSDNGTLENFVTTAANVTVVDDPFEATSTVSALPTISSNSSSLTNLTNDVPEKVQVVLIEKNFNGNYSWEDLGTVMAHVTISYKEENKIDSDSSSLLSNDGFSTETNKDILNPSETPLSLPKSIEKDNITKGNETFSSVFDNHVNFNCTSNSNKNLAEVVMTADSYSIFPFADSTDVTLTTPIFLDKLNASDYHTHSDFLNSSLPQSDSTENINKAVFSSRDDGITVTKPYSTSSIRSNSIEFTSLQTSDSSTDTSTEETKSTSSLSTIQSTLPNSSTEFPGITRMENSGIVDAINYMTNNINNTMAEVEKTKCQDALTLAEIQITNEKFPLKITTTMTIKDVVPEEGIMVTNDESTEIPTTISTPLFQTKTKIPATNITRIRENIVGGKNMKN